MDTFLSSDKIPGQTTGVFNITIDEKKLHWPSYIQDCYHSDDWYQQTTPFHVITKRWLLIQMTNSFFLF